MNLSKLVLKLTLALLMVMVSLSAQANSFPCITCINANRERLAHELAENNSPPKDTKVYKDKIYLCHSITMVNGVVTDDKSFFVDTNGNITAGKQEDRLLFDDESISVSKPASNKFFSAIYFSNKDSEFYAGSLTIDRENLTFVFTKNYVRKSGKDKYFVFKGTCF